MYYDAWYDKGITMWPWSTKDRFIPSEEILLKAQGREVDGLRRNELGKEEVSPGRRGLLHGGRVVTEREQCRAWHGQGLARIQHGWSRVCRATTRDTDA